MIIFVQAHNPKNWNVLFLCLRYERKELPNDNAIGRLAIYHIHLDGLRIEVKNYRLRDNRCAIYIETLK
jgi:hypothetical protein